MVDVQQSAAVVHAQEVHIEDGGRREHGHYVQEHRDEDTDDAVLFVAIEMPVKLVGVADGKITAQQQISEKGTEDIIMNYFEKMDHSYEIRNNKFSLKLPKVNTNIGRNRFFFKAAIIFNELSLDVRLLSSRALFVRAVDDYFS